MIRFENPAIVTTGAYAPARLANGKRVSVRVLSEPHPTTGLRRVVYGFGMHQTHTVAH